MVPRTDPGGRDPPNPRARSRRTRDRDRWRHHPAGRSARTGDAGGKRSTSEGRTSLLGNESQAMTTNKERSWRALAIRFGIVKERNADLAGEDVSHVFGEDDEVGLTRSSRVVLIVFAGFVAFLLWAWLADLDEVSTG